jgi:hypothetical protein
VALDVRPPGLRERTAPGRAGVIDQQVDLAVVLAREQLADAPRRIGVGEIDRQDGCTP